MSALEVGPELDALVADRVMGWLDVQPKTSSWFVPSGYRPDELRVRSRVPDYSTDIAAAMTVLDALGGRVTITRGLGEWTVAIGEHMAWGETLALAICRAALLAVEVPA